MFTSQLRQVKAKYSIFLPVKNGGKYIATVIDSILVQQLHDFVLIILENKSTDNTMSIIRGYEDPRIFVVEAPIALGICENWKRIYDFLATKTIETEFCTIIGHDDVFYHNFLSVVDALVADYPDASLFQTHFDMIDENNTVFRTCKPIPLHETYRDFFLARCWAIRDSFGTGYVFRTSDYIKIGGIPDLPLLLWSDDLMIMRLTRLSYKVTATEVGSAYRQHSKSTSGSKTKNRFVLTIEAANNFVSIIRNEFGELLVDVYGKASLGYMIELNVMFLKNNISRYVFDSTINQILANLESVSAELLGNLDRRSIYGQSFFDKSRWVVKKIFYKIKLALWLFV